MEHGTHRLETCAEAGVMGLRRLFLDNPDGRLLILCDPTLDDPLRQDAEGLGLSFSPIHIRSGQAVPPKPYLIHVGGYDFHEAFVNRSIRLSVEQALKPSLPNRRSRSICAWLWTELSTAEISDLVRERAAITDTRGSKRVLRFWDPRATQHISALFPGRSKASWLPGTAWGFVDGFGTWGCLPDKNGEREAAWVPDGDALHLYSLVNAVLQRLSIGGLRYQADVISDVRESLKIGRQRGLIDEDDQVCFAADRIEAGVPIERSGQITSIFNAVHEFGAGYRSMVDGFDEEDWDVIRAEAREKELVKDRE